MLPPFSSHTVTPEFSTRIACYTHWTIAAISIVSHVNMKINSKVFCLVLHYTSSEKRKQQLAHGSLPHSSSKIVKVRYPSTLHPIKVLVEKVRKWFTCRSINFLSILEDCCLWLVYLLIISWCWKFKGRGRGNPRMPFPMFETWLYFFNQST